MQDQNKEQKILKSPKTLKKKINFILSVLLGLIICFIIYNYQCILNSFEQLIKPDLHVSKQITSSTTTSVKEIDPPTDKRIMEVEVGSDDITESRQDEEIADEKALNNSNDDESFASDSSIKRFGPDVQFKSYEDNPYDEYVDEQSLFRKPTEIEKNLLFENLRNYRIYIASANELLILFLQQKDYSEQLDKLKQVKLPIEIREIITLMEEHLKLLGSNVTSKQIFPINSKSFEKIIKITQTTEALKKRGDLESKIMKKLKIFTSYIYSQEVQEQFLGSAFTQNPSVNNHD